MMRPARRASLVVAFSLLASAATAYAECAWVLWVEEETTIKNEKKSGGTFTSSPEWKVMQAEANEAGCVKALTTIVAMAEATGKPTRGATANVLRFGDRAILTLTYPESDPFWVKS